MGVASGAPRTFDRRQSHQLLAFGSITAAGIYRSMIHNKC